MNVRHRQAGSLSRSKYLYVPGVQLQFCDGREALSAQITVTDRASKCLGLRRNGDFGFHRGRDHEIETRECAERAEAVHMNRLMSTLASVTTIRPC